MLWNPPTTKFWIISAISYIGTGKFLAQKNIWSTCLLLMAILLLTRYILVYNCHLKFKQNNVFGCQWFIPWLVDAIHQSSFQWSKSGLHCSQMTSIQICMQTPPTSGFEPAKGPSINEVTIFLGGKSKKLRKNSCGHGAIMTLTWEREESKNS